MDKINHPTFTYLTTCYTWKKIIFYVSELQSSCKCQGVCFSFESKVILNENYFQWETGHPRPVWEVHPSGQTSHWHSTHAGGCGMKKDAGASEELWKLKQRGSFLSWEVPAIFTPQLYWISHSENTWRYAAIFLSKDHSVFLNMAITAQNVEFNHKMHPGAMKCVWN